MSFQLNKDGVFDSNGQHIVTNRTNNRSTYDGSLLNAGTYYKVAELDIDDGGHLITVYWGGGYNSSGSTIHWATRAAGVVGLTSTTNYYNANPYQLITMSYTHHYRTVGNPSFYAASDNSNGAYGKLSLYMVPASQERFTDFRVYLQRLTDI